MPPIQRLTWTLGGALLASTLLAGPALASSHREAPLIAGEPRLDSTDTYMFRSYEPGRSNFTTLIANYIPLQDPNGGPNYFALDDMAAYDINIDNVGDGQEHITFRFRIRTNYGYKTLNIGGKNIGVPLETVGPIGLGNLGNLNFQQVYEATVIRRGPGGTTEQPITWANSGGRSFGIPIDNIGNKTIPDYASYANKYVALATIPGCGNARIFVGQRKDPFVLNLGQVFDLINVKNPIGEQFANAAHDDLIAKNVTTFAMEVPTSCLVAKDPVIGMWTSASKEEPVAIGSSTTKLVQHSRLGMPLTNELLISIADKDKWNYARPIQFDGGIFKGYVTNPTFPALVEALFGAAGVRAPTAFPRLDLQAVFLTGIAGVNKPAGNPALTDQLRLNTSLPITAAAAQNRLGVIGGDNAGFPNGRRPGDDVVDVALRVAMGRLYTLGLFGKPADAPSGALDFTDGAIVNAGFFDTKFPYLRTPIAGSPGPLPN